MPASETQSVLESSPGIAASAQPSLRAWVRQNDNHLTSRSSENLSVPSLLKVSALIKIKVPGLIQQQEIKNRKAAQSLA